MSIPCGRACLLLIVLVALAMPAAARERCPNFFAGGTAPAITKGKLAVDTVPLCFGAFALLFSGASRTPLYAGERLTRASVAAARAVDRTDSFYEETRLPSGDRSLLRDYVRSGFDRGHMAPAGDMPSPETQAESFSLANIIPQDRASNRGLWSAIEESVRRLATRRGELFVVTGPVFSGRSIESLGGRVLVPTQLYKAVYDPVRGEAAAYLARNDAAGALQIVSIDALREIAGIDVFPNAPHPVKARAMALPEPREFSRDGGRSRAPETSWFKDQVHRALRRLWRDIMQAIF